MTVRYENFRDSDFTKRNRSWIRADHSPPASAGLSFKCPESSVARRVCIPSALTKASNHGTDPRIDSRKPIFASHSTARRFPKTPDDPSLLSRFIDLSDLSSGNQSRRLFMYASHHWSQSTNVDDTRREIPFGGKFLKKRKKKKEKNPTILVDGSSLGWGGPW